VDALHLGESGRISAEDSTVAKAFEKKAFKVMKRDGSLDALTKMFQGWMGADSTSTEHEISRAVFDYVGEGVGAKMNITKLLTREGNVFCEFDGILMCGNRIIAVEAKHRVTQHYISCSDPSSPGLVEKLDKLKEFQTFAMGTDLSGDKRFLAQLSAFRPYANFIVTGAIGGIHFDDSLRTYAQRKGLMVVFPNGSRFEVEETQAEGLLVTATPADDCCK
jgi:hypothetical protein